MTWSAEVVLRVSISYDDIEADSMEEANEIAKERAAEDIDFNNCDCDLDDPYVFSIRNDD